MQTEIKDKNLDYRYTILDMRDLGANIFLESADDAERVLALLCDSPDPRADGVAVLEAPLRRATAREHRPSEDFVPTAQIRDNSCGGTRAHAMRF